MKRLILILAILLFISQAFALSASDVMAYYKFDETTGLVAADSNGSAHPGAITEASINQVGKIGQAYDFNYSARVIPATESDFDLFTTTGSWTITFWEKPTNRTTTATDNVAISKYTSASDIGILTMQRSGDSNKLKVQLATNGSNYAQYRADTTTPLQDGSTWYFVVIRSTSGVINVKINDVNQALTKTGSGTFSGGNSANPMHIGTSDANNNGFFGRIDEVGFFNKALSDAELTSLYNSGTGLTYPFTGAVAQAKVDWNVYRAGTTSHLTSVTADCNVNSMDFTTQNSPITGVYVDQNTAFTCNFTRTGYDANNSFVGTADSNKTLTIYLTDSTAPSVGATTTNSFTIVGTQIWGTGNIYATATDTGSDINSSGCQYTINNGASWAAADRNSTHCYKTGIVVTAGTTPQYNLRAYDNANNLGTGTATIQYTADNVAPSVGTATISGFNTYISIYIKGTGTIAATQSDATSGTASCEYSIDNGSNWFAADKNATHCYKAGIAIADQNYTFKFRATDNAGNLGTGTASDTYVGDITAPTTTFTSNQITGTTDTNATLSCSDSKSGCKYLFYSIDSGAWTQTSGSVEEISVNTGISYSGAASASQYGFVFQPSVDINFTGIKRGANSTAEVCEIFDYSRSLLGTMNTSGLDNNLAIPVTLTQDTNYIIACGKADNGLFTSDEAVVSYPVALTNLTLIAGMNGIQADGSGGNYSYTNGWEVQQFYLTELSNGDISNYNFTIPGTGDHNIQYYSLDNLDNNETINTDLFSTTGYLYLKTYDENSMAVFTGNINFNGVDYNSVTGADINLSGLADGNYTITFSKPTYGTRTYTLAMTEYTDMNINMLMLSTGQGSNLKFTLFQPDQLTIYPNASMYITRPDKNDFTIGTYRTNNNGKVTIFTNLYDQNYLFNINEGEEIYQPVALTIKKPIDEESGATISTNYSITISGAGSQDYNDVANDKVVWLLPNIDLAYKIKIQDVNSLYFPRNYYKNYYGNPLTDTLQPYLISALTGLLTTIRSISGTSNAPIPEINVKIYKDLQVGRTLVEDIITDYKGESLAYMVTGDQYYFDIYYNGSLVRSDTIQATSSVIYIRLDDLVYSSPILGNISAMVNYYPSVGALSQADKKLIQVIKINDSNSTTTITGIVIQVWNTDRNGVAGASVKVYEDYTIYADENSITNTIDINALSQIINTTTWYDTNGLLQVKVIIIASDANYISTFSYKPYMGFNAIYSVGFGSRSLFGCSSYYDSYGNPNPLIPCPNQLFLALFISFILTAGIGFGMKFNSPAGLGIIFALIMGIFTFLTFVPIVLYGIMVAGLVTLIIVGRGRFN